MSSGADKPVDSPPWSASTKTIIVSAALVLAGLVVWRFQFIITPLVIAAVLAYLLNPLISWLERTAPLRRIYAVLVVYVGLLVIGGGAVTALGFAAASQASRLAAMTPDLIPNVVSFVEETVRSWSEAVIAFGPYEFHVGSLWADVDVSLITSQLRTGLQQLAGRSGSLIADLAKGTVNTFANGLLIFFVSLYISKDAPLLGRAIGDLAQQPGYREDADRLMNDTLAIWNAYLRGQVVLALTIGAVVSASLGVLGVNNALALGLLSGLLEFLPTLGPIIGAVAATAVAILQPGNYLGLSPWVYGLLILGVMTAIQQIENSVLVPRIVGDALDLHPIAVIVGVMMGASLAGLLGAVLAAPVLATVKLLGVYIWRKILDLPPFPPDASEGEMEDGVSTAGMWGRVRRWVEGRRAVGMRQTRHQAKVTEMTDVLAGNDPTPTLYPLLFDPVFKDYPWGGRNLAERFGRSLPDGIVAESWDIAAHPNGSSTVRNGALAGRTLPQALEVWGEALVGKRNARSLQAGKFPLLVKLLDANAWLSVQVHPDDAYGLANEGEYGKTEMWIVLHAEPGAELIYGFRPGVTRDAFAAAIAEERTADFLHRLPVKKGDVIFVPAGTVHALGPGVIVAEIQQNSDTTYRIYDWGRPRPLHIDKALDVLNFDQVEPGAYEPTQLDGDGQRRELIGECAYFRTERFELAPGASYAGECDGVTFEIWGVLEGSAALEGEWGTIQLDAVEWVLLPAELGAYTVKAIAPLTALRVFTPATEDED